MKDLDCNVIRDLMPSYLDEICSKESRNLVDAHLTSCAQCRVQIELLKRTELTDEQREPVKLSYLKKLKHYYMKKEILNVVLLIFVITGGFWLMQNFHSMLGLHSLYLFFPLFLFATYSLVPQPVVPPKTSRLSGFLTGMSLVLLAVFFVLVILSLPIGRGEYVLRIPTDEIGYYFNRWIHQIAFLQIGIFAAANLLRLFGYGFHKAIYGLTLTGVALASGFLCILGNLATVEAFYEMLAKMLACVVLEGGVCSGISCCIVKKVMR